MRITRYANEAICINDRLLVTLHAQTSHKCVLHITDYLTEESRLEILDANEELVISDYGTTMTPVEFGFDSSGAPMTTFEIEHDPRVSVHRLEAGWLQ